MWARDAPRSLGSEEGLRHFHVEELKRYLTDLSPLTVEELEHLETDLAPTGFQIWGLPSGAERVLRSMVSGDFLLLLENEEFRYAGQVLMRLQEPSWDLSGYLWGEQRFPLIVFLQGQLIRYEWEEFKAEFGFDSRYHMRGNTMRLADSKIANSRFESEEQFIASLLGTDERHAATAEAEFELFAARAEAHLRLVRDRTAQSAFRDEVLRKQDVRCTVCDFAIPEGLEAAHLVPKRSSGTDDARNGLALCVLHHRLFDRGLFHIEPDSLEIVPREPWTLADLRITNLNIRGIRSAVHEAALRWNADNAKRRS
jgi:hypothetical protein